MLSVAPGNLLARAHTAGDPEATAGGHGAAARRPVVRLVAVARTGRRAAGGTDARATFPWPQDATPKQKSAIEQAAQKVLDVRKEYPDSSLADLYDPNTMPAPLLKAHQALDKAVDRAYRSAPFTSESQRVAYLFEEYQKLTRH